MKTILTLCIACTCSFWAHAQMHKVAPYTDLFTDNSSADGVQGQSFIHMHNRKGIRVEYAINRRALELWISPLAGKSLVYIDRNFSNRDDHTTLFDKIQLPHLHASLFDHCEYDPFHSIIYYKNGQKMHLLSVFDKPAIMVWFEKAEWIDIKTDKQDKLIRTEPNLLATQHSERGKVLQFAAGLGTGSGKMIHQKHADPFRSHNTRVYAAPNQPLILAGDDVSENILQMVAVLAFQDLETTLLQNKNLIERAVRPGKITLKGQPDLQKIIDLNKKVLLSMQDESGAIRAALRYIYYLIWHRDGAMVNAYSAYSGWTAPLRDWTQFELANPTTMEFNGKPERFFGQLVGGKITKLEEDGPFYGIWSAFTYWTATGDTRYLQPKQMMVLEDNLKWLENNYFDASKGLFFRYHYCESPYYKSYGDGWDDAMGTQTKPNISRYGNDTITRAYDLYINYIVYASYLMMSAMETNSLSGVYLAKAKQLEATMLPKFKGVLPTYGYYTSTKNTEIESAPFGLDATDFVWGLTVPPFMPNYADGPAIRAAIRKHQTDKPKDNFYPEWFSTLAAMDTELEAESDIVSGITYVVPQCVKPGTCLPMPYTVCEIVDVEDCNVYHDVRPQAFSISALIASVSNLAVKKYPFGIALRPNNLIAQISDYDYKNSTITVTYSGSGSYIKKILLNGSELKNTLQIPDNLLKPGANQVQITLSTQAPTNTRLIGSTVQLISMKGQKASVKAYGKNVLIVKNALKSPIIVAADGSNIACKAQQQGAVSYFEFEGIGNFEVKF